MTTTQETASAEEFNKLLEPLFGKVPYEATERISFAFRRLRARENELESKVNDFEEREKGYPDLARLCARLESKVAILEGEKRRMWKHIEELSQQNCGCDGDEESGPAGNCLACVSEKLLCSLTPPTDSPSHL